MTKPFLFFILLFVFLSSCTEQEKEAPPINYGDMKEDLIKQNQVWHKEEMLEIESYVKRHGWNVITTGSGLKYIVYQKKDTTLPLAQEGQIVIINYSISMLNDSICYSSEGDPDDFLIGMDNVESGLHEGMTYMRKGEKAKIILPSNLAFGLVGDMEKIPPQAPLIYDVELVEILDADTKKPVGDEKKSK